jgi:argininosuccinate lyase
MPQKRNPDVAELIRGKSGRLTGNLIALLTVLKGLPMTYNRDMQEDKEPVFDSIDTIKLCLEGMIEMLSTMEINREKMKEGLYRNFSTATDIADYLVKKGISFRESHEISGSIVKYCEENNKDFFKLSAAELRNFSPLIDEEIGDVLDPLKSVERKLSEGGTSLSSVQKQIVLLKSYLG